MAEPAFKLEDILSILPHRPPFLFVDQVISVVPFSSIVAERKLRPEESFFEGHFPDEAIMPGVLVAEALAQTCGLLLALSEKLTGAPPPARPKKLLAATNFKFSEPAYPNETLELTAQAQEKLGAIFRFNAQAQVGKRSIAVGSLMLAHVGEH